MPGYVRVTVNKGALIRKFRALVPAADEELVAAAMKGAEDVAALARRFMRSDRLRNSVKAEPVPERLGARVVVGDESTRVELRKGSGEYVNLALTEEFGTKPHENEGKFAGSHHPGTKPYPALFPAARLLKKSNKARMARALGKAARKVSG
jgi:hypothetical protein